MHQRPKTRATWLPGIAVALPVAVSAFQAVAGGFEIQQSAYFQGMSFAGAAAGGPSLASIGWNPATSAFAGNGLTFESSYALALPEVDLTVLNPDAQLPPPGTDKVDMGRDAFLVSGFGAWRLNEKAVLGLSLIAPFGLGTKPDDVNWAGKYVATKSKVVSVNAIPSASYEISPGLSIGAGVQLQYFDLTDLRAATPLGISTIDGDDFDVGFMLGINFSPVESTSIGLGFRSSVKHSLEGDTTIDVSPGAAALLGLGSITKAPTRTEIELPEKLTFSFRQSLSSRTRLLGTADWVNWSRFGTIPAVLEGPLGLGPLAPAIPSGSTIANLSFEWEDGWFFALGGEYDWSPNLTLRTGLSYEISPVQTAATRLVQVPDSDQIWLSFGATYKVSPNSSIDFAYSHIFYEKDARFSRFPSSTLVQSPSPLIGTADINTDVISFSWKWALGPSTQ